MPNIIYPITFKLQEDPSEEPISGAYVSIWNRDFTTLVIPNLTTDENGFTVIGLPAERYNAVFFCEGFNFPNTVYFEVTDRVTLTVHGDVTVVSPIVMGYCLLYGYVNDISSKPIFDTIVKIRLNPAPQYPMDKLISKENFTIYTNENGYFEISLLANTKVTVTIPECSFQVAGMLPSRGRINVTELDKQFTSI
jgi:hypothetical protein